MHTLCEIEVIAVGCAFLSLPSDINGSIEPKAGNAIRSKGGRIFVVLLGGVSASEIMSVYDLTRSTHQQVSPTQL